MTLPDSLGICNDSVPRHILDPTNRSRASVSVGFWLAAKVFPGEGMTHEIVGTQYLRAFHFRLEGAIIDSKYTITGYMFFLPKRAIEESSHHPF